MKKNWVELYKKYGIYILLVVVFAFFAVAAPNFLAAKNVINILFKIFNISYIFHKRTFFFII